MDRVANGVCHMSWQPDVAAARLWCPTCNWRKKGSQSAVVAAGTKHVKTTGHRVQVYRSQWKAISPVRDDDDA